MNIGVEFGANPLEIYDGGDRDTWAGTADWVFSVPVGNPGDFDETSTDHAKNARIQVTNNAAINDLDTITITTNVTGSVVLTEDTDWDKLGNAALTSASIAAAFVTNALFDGETDGVDQVNFWTSNTEDIQSIAFSGAGLSESAQSLDFTDAKENDVFQLTSGAGDVDLSAYSSITGYIWIDKWKNEGMTLQGYDNGTVLIGNSINIADYVLESLDKWQKFTIPLQDLGLKGLTSTFDALRFSPQHKDWKGYIDYVEIQETGSVDVTSFYVKPEKGTWLYVHNLAIVMADTMAGTLVNATMPALSYENFLGVTELNNGIVYQRLEHNVVRETLIIKNIGDFLQFPTSELSVAISDGTKTYIKMGSDFIEPVLLKAEDDDFLKITISDSLAGLLLCRISVGAKKMVLADQV
jgi:hypothetical protein